VLDAVGDVLSQTYRELELIVVDDGSTDGTASVMASVADGRIRLVRHDRNRGLSAALNSGIAASQGELIARMDADDRTQPERIARQVALFAANPRLGVAGTGADFVELPNDVMTPFVGPANDLPLQRAMLSLNWIVHGSAMARRSALDAVGGYRAATEPAEDYDIWLRVSELYEIALVPERLYTYFKHKDSVSAKNLDRQRVAAARALDNAVARRAGRADDLGLRLDLDHARATLGRSRLALHHAAWAARLARRGRRADAAAVARRLLVSVL
jgi:glycosyltransferase involved in cell wall biosynthesis